MIKIVVLSGPMDGFEFRTDKSEITLGKDSQHIVALPLDPQVSQNHARITREGDEYWVEDTGSSNGTFVENQRVESKVVLPPETIFKMGRTALKLKVIQSPEDDTVVCKCGVKNSVFDKWCKNCGRELLSSG